MGWNPALEPHCPAGPEIDAIETVIVPARGSFALLAAHYPMKA